MLPEGANHNTEKVAMIVQIYNTKFDNQI